MTDALSLRGNGDAAAACQGCPMRAELITRAEDAILAKNDLLATIEKLSRDLRRAEGKLEAKHKHDPLAGAVEAWLEYWHARTSTGRGKPPDMSAGGDRWAKVLRVLQRKVEHARRIKEPEPVDWALSELKLAVDGILLSPWHMGDNPARRRYLKVENVLKSEEATDAFIEAGRGEAGRLEVPVSWLTPESWARLQESPWLISVIADAMDVAIEWNQRLELELRDFREFRSVSVLEVAQDPRLSLETAA